ncbi:hypothetical protein DFQ27_003477 [Actinomortierella ambigua]|uniref:Uncharacterized protein n=1 Tax=Actinomortierella ambigua TaxID=1343610 RepID=A0A9P6Q4K5_9FUNG|nr:hypothetical protein DFQ27_003477 [Actinomortierella ambigua]
MKFSAVLIAVCAAVASAAPLISTSGTPVPDSYIVVLKGGNTAESFQNKFNEIARRQNGRGRTPVISRKYKAIDGFAAELNQGALDELLAAPEVDYVEQDQIITLQASQPSPPSWGLPRTSQRDRNLSAPYFYQDAAGQGVTAYIIDTGVYIEHSDFGGRASYGYNAISGSSNTDENGHGTHVAGTVGGTRFGVAKNVNLVGVKVLNAQGSGTTAGVVAGMDWVINRARGTKAVANMSLGGGKSATMDAAANRFYAANIPLFVAAGNSAGTSACNQSPAGATQAYTVAASDSSDRFASFSSWGTCVEIIAPGVGITSAWIGGTSATNTISGTSMATPHVCGAAALLISAEAGLTTSQAVFDRLTNLATPNKITGNLRSTPNRLLFNGAV